MPGLRDQDKDEDNEDEEDYTYTNNKGIPGVTTRSGRVVKQAESYKDADYSYTQNDFGDFAFSESRNADKVKVLKHEDEVANYIESLTAIEGSDDYVDYIKAKQFTQYSIKKGLKEFPDEGK